VQPSAVLLLVLALGAGCAGAASAQQGPRVVRPGAPGEASRTVSATAPAALPHTDADVRFMQGMIHHHAQALEMTALLMTRTTRDDMKLLARRIELSQLDEIGMMEQWLKARGQDVPDVEAHRGHGGMLMPGMLTPEQMARLASVRGAAFDRLFLEGMIAHHAGALTMVRDLLASPGAAQEGEIFAFASDVEADQSIEIRRMQAMLAGGS
jgi:uncharacterized protein (DUF305 family)